MTTILDPKEIDYVVKNINKSLQVYSIDDITIEELSQLIFTKLIGNGVSARIIEYSYNGKPFQSVQYYKQKTWFNFNYSSLDMFFQPVYNRTLNPQNIIKEEMVDVQYATPEYPDESDDNDGDTEITQEEVNNGVTNWISNYLSNFTSMVTNAVNDYLASHKADFKGDKGDNGINGVGLPSGTHRLQIFKATSGQLTNVNTFIFNNLDGNSDLEYLIVIEGLITNSQFLGLYPNNNSSGTDFRNATNLVTEQNINTQKGVAGEGKSCPGFVLFGGQNVNTRYIKGSTILTLSTNKPRQSLSNYNSAINNSVHIGSSATIWNDLNTNITSLTLKLTDNGTFTGIIKIYKIVDLVVP